MKAATQPRRIRNDSFGFSLAELLFVICIMAVVATLAANSLNSLSSTAELNSSIQGVSGILNTARQLALSQNKYVQVRFYEQNDASDARNGHYFAMGIYHSDSPFYGSDAEYDKALAQGTFAPAGRIYVLPKSVAILKSPQNSKLLNALELESARRGKDTTGRMKDKNWVAFYYNPNGTLDAPMVGTASLQAPKSFFSMCEARKFQGGNSPLPENHAVVLLDPASGRMQCLRP